ncbi:MAG TPA: FtsX-like permease family protein, partial [Anaerolineaceae bacterium]|nr:FtsX-like permease family protein [Anaerolineaceae bacterium]
MTTTGFFIRTALNNLRRGGQRVWVAVLCITFGVMSLVAMTLMARSTERVIIMPPDEKIGGDLLLYPADGGALSPEDIADLQQKQQDGVIDAYTLQAPTSTLIFHVPGSGNYRFVSNGIGIEPETYPLRGPLTISEPGNIGITSLLQEVGDVLVTVDLANSYDLKVGDTLILSTIDVGQTVAGKVRGVVSDTPNHAGGKLYYSIDTAKQLAGSEQVVQQAIATSPNPDAASQQFETSGWAAFTAEALAGQFKDQDDLFSILFRGAGILGLMVGGIGIANTMQVLLRRRQREIAIWKTIGYSQADLRAMFVTEAAVMGVIGSLVGAALGIGISYQLLELLRRTGNMLLVWDIRPSLGTIAASMLIGVFTTIIFAMWAIVNASRVSPSGLLREEPIKAQQMPWFQGIFLMLALSVPFTIFTSYVMRSVTYGVGVLLFALAGLVVIGGFLAGLAWMVTHLLPVKHLPLVRMAQQNLHRRGRSLVFAMIALFAGVVTLAMGVMVTETAQREYEARDIDIEGYNLVIVAPWAQEKQIADALETTGVAKTVWGSRTEVSSIKVLGDVNQTDLDPVLVGRSTPYDYPVQGAEWGSQPDGVYTPFEAQAGAQVEVILADGST